MSDVEEKKVVTELFGDLNKKKKKKSKKESTGEEDEEKASTPVEGEDFEFKKKKKKKSKSSAADAFDEQLEAAGINEVAEEGSAEEKSDNASDNTDLTYSDLLSRFFGILRENNPELAGDRGTKYKIPPPVVTRDGSKKSLFANVKEISERMKRPSEHVIQYLFAELGTSGSIDGASRLIIKGRFQPKQIENVLRSYIMEYVACPTCKSANTLLQKENRLYFLVCQACGSTRTVSSIKTGFQAHVGRRKKVAA
ncbi:hypothetical protein NADFUDRAFT_20137 [Nadsonia fulvescens var. elongata DSM 6958]|uniref:Translation initiation factor IF2/IF5 domain-containing protein n=1 Tax=Nadsonia fulvescens var. elongata DSM 6958 TaxID=857566 RepID=A0A1E3PUK9_9ASCO|nr:hypothetical protein NADFUDRAFT_20137 [Nadsonia fulvescens var. elongata DSM 6958]